MRFLLEITLRCNMNCPQCHAHCGKRLPYLQDTDMTMEQVERFTAQVLASKIEIARLSITGGEPMLHPHLLDIIGHLENTLVREGRILEQMRLLSNGIVPIPLDLRKRIFWRNRDGPPAVRAKRHKATWIAPEDAGLQGKPCKYRCCTQLTRCGPILSVHGYAPCQPGAAIARLFGWQDIFKHDFPVDGHLTWEKDAIRRLCRVCHYSVSRWKQLNAAEHPKPSRTYRSAFRAAKKRQELPRYF